MLNRVLLSACMLVCSSTAEAQGCSDLASAHPPFTWAGTQPLVLLTEYNPWAMVIGADSPTFALYVDGTVIYWEGERQSGKYMTATLAPSEVAELIQTAHLDGTRDFASCYSIADYTDAPSNVLVFRTEKGYRTVDVYGVIRHSENSLPDRMPTDLREALTVLANNGEWSSAQGCGGNVLGVWKGKDLGGSRGVYGYASEAWGYAADCEQVGVAAAG